MRASHLVVFAVVVGWLLPSCASSTGDSDSGCTTDVECKGTRLCVDGQCVDPGRSDSDGGGVLPDGGVGPAACGNSRRDNDETDTDCGGPQCAPCGDGRSCQAARDCVSSLCVNGKCSATSCTDNVRNGRETGVDCGGGQCPACGPNQHCASGSDCASGVCRNEYCTAPEPTCTDRIRNGTETDVDCGGSCLPCDDAKECKVNADCSGMSCQSGKCATAKCNDRVLNGDETDLDCGGSCPPCGQHLLCTQDSDCFEMFCVSNRCTATCFDGKRNGFESDVDCGGYDCAKCGYDRVCGNNSDCDSQKCSSQSGGGRCAQPTCYDKIKDGKETDVDCGGDFYGSGCAKCAKGKKCLVDWDCSSNICLTGSCY